MHGAEVGATGADHDAGDRAFAARLTASSLIFLIRAMVFLELTSLSSNVSVVRHRISTQVDTFLQKSFHSREG